jgi:hypothetical protein
VVVMVMCDKDGLQFEPQFGKYCQNRRRIARIDDHGMACPA